MVKPPPIASMAAPTVPSTSASLSVGSRVSPPVVGSGSSHSSPPGARHVGTGGLRWNGDGRQSVVCGKEKVMTMPATPSLDTLVDQDVQFAELEARLVDEYGA